MRWILTAVALCGSVQIVTGSLAHADDFNLEGREGSCAYWTDRESLIRKTRCVAEAHIFDVRSSNVLRCRAEVSGLADQIPPVRETVPEKVFCQTLGQPFTERGPYGFALLDDFSFVEDTKRSREGQFTWSNAYWVYRRTDPFEIKICSGPAGLAANPDFSQQCSATYVITDEPRAPSSNVRVIGD